MTLRAPPPALCAVRISVYTSGWLTWILMLCAEWQPAIKPDLWGTYRLSQPPRGMLLPLGSTFTFCLVFASWMWRPTQMQRRISTSDRADNLRAQRKGIKTTGGNQNTLSIQNCIKVREFEKAITRLPWNWEDAIDDRILCVLSWLDIHVSYEIMKRFIAISQSHKP